MTLSHVGMWLDASSLDVYRKEWNKMPTRWIKTQVQYNAVLY